MDASKGLQSVRGSDIGRGRGGRGRGGERSGFRGGRSEFSAPGPSEDQSITTIVVEQIPQEKFNEAGIRGFFSQFGNIADITLHNYRNLALIKYESHAEAKAAWSSPKVIFDNRFVKVYWQKSKEKAENGGEKKTGGEASEESKTPPFDREGFEKRQEEAQRAYEEKTRKRKEMEAAKQTLDQQQEELKKKQQEGKIKLLQKLGMQSNGTDSVNNGHGEDGIGDEQTRQLRAQLAALEEEAKTLGLDTANADSHPGRGRGRGVYRGRGGYVPRGRGFDPRFRGGYRGRGAARGRGSSVLRLDNRPKRVAVSGVLLHSEQDEALRQYLTVSLMLYFDALRNLNTNTTYKKGVGQYEAIEPHPEKMDSLVVVFKERYQAEKFMYGPHTIPSVGPVELSWVNGPPSAEARGVAIDEPRGEMNVDSAFPPPDQLGARRDAVNEMDYDVAEEDDSWGMQ